MTGVVSKYAGHHLLPYQHLYTSSPMSMSILKQYFDLPEDQVIPLSISHGIDFNHERYAQDVTNVEPIHWCYNDEILRRSKKIKKTTTLPHPWMMLHNFKGSPKVKENGKILVIGPPPSTYNDENLLFSLFARNIKADAILLKARGGKEIDRSDKFWRNQKVLPVSAGGRDNLHYHRLMDLLLEYEFVVSPFLSSVTILASALGSKILVLNNYQYCTYGIEQLDFQSMYSAPTLRAMVSTYVRSGTESDSVEIAEDVLGKKFLQNYDISKENFLDEINSVRKPLYVHSAGGSRTSAYVLSNIARLSGRSGFLKYGITAGVRYKVFGTQNSIICKKINMIDAAINGLSEKNFSIRVLTDKERNAVPGQGADW